MFSKTVVVAGRSIPVFCSQDTPLSEVVRRAADLLRQEEIAASAANPDTMAYRKAIESISR